MSERDEAKRCVQEFDRAWGEYANPLPLPRDPDWTVSIRRWLKRGMDPETLLTFADRVVEDERFQRPTLDGWKFLCGMCSRHLKELGL